MAVISQVLVEVTHLVARAVVNQARQETISPLPSSPTIPGTTTVLPTSFSSSSLPFTTPDPTATRSTMDSNPSATGNTGNTGSNNSGNNPNNNATSSPLLFFVALGFGVVFTNLW
jgi:hypothetical protein